MRIRDQAEKWMMENFPSDVKNLFRASKYHPEQDIWFFTFPITYLDSERAGDLNIFLQFEKSPNQFHLLKVPFSFFRENEKRFDIRSTGEKFDLHISAKKQNWLECKRSKNVSFKLFEQ